MLKHTLYISLASLFMLGQLVQSQDNCKIEPSLLEELSNGGTANVIIIYKWRNLPAFSRNYEEEGQTLIDSLKEHATETQSEVMQILESRKKRNEESAGFSDIKSFWLGNKGFIADASLEALKEICNWHGIEIIIKEPIARIPEFTMTGIAYDIPDENITEENENIPQEIRDGLWGLTIAGIKQVWAEYRGGTTGNGSLVVSIDNGVQASHEALKYSFVGTEYGWFDALDGLSEPGDSFGLHGTIQMGIMVGGRGIGVAPDAKWMTCRACNDDLDCPAEAILTCLQFALCPTKPDGTEPKCSKQGRVLSLPWYMERGSEFFKDELAALYPYSAIPISHVGDNGPDCMSAVSPGDMFWNIFGVGVTDKDDYLWSKSGIGNLYSSHSVPKFVAPGVGITSSVIGSPDRYAVFTSPAMASAFAAGALALFSSCWSYYPYYDRYYDYMYSHGTDRTVKLNPDVNYCEADSIEKWPNIYAGVGRINIWKLCNLY